MGNTHHSKRREEKYVETIDNFEVSIVIKAAPSYTTPDIRYKQRVMSACLDISPPGDSTERAVLSRDTGLAPSSAGSSTERAVPSSADMRNRFYLALARVMPLKDERPSNSRTVFLYEWDDGLLCTSYLAKLKGKAFEPSTKEELQPLDAAIVMPTLESNHSSVLSPRRGLRSEQSEAGVHRGGHGPVAALCPGTIASHQSQA